MITVDIFSESQYKINRKRIKKLAEEYLRNYGVRGKTEASIKIVGNRKMKTLGKKYRGKDEKDVVLSFPLLESDSKTLFVYPPDDVLRLGDIVISYPQACLQAAKEEKLVDKVIDELVIHGLGSLLGNQQS